MKNSYTLQELENLPEDEKTEILCNAYNYGVLTSWAWDDGNYDIVALLEFMGVEVIQ